MSFKKKIILFLLAISIALPKDFLEHAIEFPALVAHFIHHYHHDHVSVSEFLAMHEEGSEHHDDIDHEHLPFNHHHNSDCFQQNFTFAPIQFADFYLHNYSNVKSIHCCYNETFTSSYASNFWQPPKFS